VIAPPTSPPAPLVPLLTSELEDPSFGKNCIGCSPRNVKGLHLHFAPHGHEVRAEVLLDDSYESYPGMIHGGIIALILDEVTGRAALWHARCFVVTLGIRIRYGAIMRPGVRYVARAEVEAGPEDQLRVSGVLEEAAPRPGAPAGEPHVLVATAVSTFAALREDRLHGAAAELPEATRALALELAALGHQHR
jgi:acyl-coenzyme A thioesterase PaaI-like protein